MTYLHCFLFKASIGFSSRFFKILHQQRHLPVAVALVVSPFGTFVHAEIQFGIEGYPLAQLLQSRSGGKGGKIELCQIYFQIRTDGEGKFFFYIIVHSHDFYYMIKISYKLEVPNSLQRGLLGVRLGFRVTLTPPWGVFGSSSDSYHPL